MTEIEGILEHIIDGAFVIDASATVVFANPDCQRIFARDRQELVGLHVAELFADLPEHWPSPGRHHVEARRSNGTLVPLRATLTPVGDALVVTLQERAYASVTPVMLEPLEDPGPMFESIADAVDAFLFAGELDGSGWYLPVLHGPGLERLLGADVDYEDANRLYDTCIHPEDYPVFERLYDHERRAPGEVEEATYRLRGLDGRTRWVRERSVLRETDGRFMLYGVVFDATAEIEARAEIERRSRTDQLTGLWNRPHLVDALSAELERARREGRLPGLLMVDLDHFKPTNDTYGHAVGDAVLREIAQRLLRAVRRYDVVARWGGEEFCILVPGVESDEAVFAVAESVRRAIEAAPVALDGDRLLNVTASVGGVLANDGLWSVEALVDAADRALYAAKRHGRNRTTLASELTVEDYAAEEPEALRLAQALALSASARERMPEDHVRQVSDLAGQIAVRLGLTEDAVMRCRLGGWLHDLGKVAIPDRVLTKRAPLDNEEWEVMRTHSEIGEQIVRRIAGLAQAALVVRHHHERVDGGGYPDGLAGEGIPIEARIVAVADAYSAIVTDRVYRPARSREEALVELGACAGVHHDPACIEALAAVLDDPAGVVFAPFLRSGG